MTGLTIEVSCDFTEESLVSEFFVPFLPQAIPPKPKGLMGKLTVGILTAARLERESPGIGICMGVSSNHPFQ